MQPVIRHSFHRQIPSRQNFTGELNGLPVAAGLLGHQAVLVIGKNPALLGQCPTASTRLSLNIGNTP